MPGSPRGSRAGCRRGSPRPPPAWRRRGGARPGTSTRPAPGRWVTAGQVADELSDRLIGLFLPDHDGRRPSDGKRIESSESPLWRNHVTFSEYFDGDTGEGLGATHQTGWTALVAGLLTERTR